MTVCWAARLDNCAGKQSREHVVSQGIWDANDVDVLGFPWCRDEAKRVGLGSLTAKILCQYHNSALSPLDQAAKAAFDALRRATVLGNERSRLRPRKWKVRRFEILGLQLERWFLKTAINLVFTHPGAMTWFGTGSGADAVPATLVRTAFGLETMAKPMGLYSLGELGEGVHMTDVLHAAPLLVGGNDIIGMIFLFRGFRFYLHLHASPMPPVLELPGQEVRWRTGELLYHLKEMSFRVAKKRSHYVQILWHDVQDC